ncbi:MAG TPA: hypothetical protein VFV50_19640, partial [Bdellovibrionales bacterium]|nr:hypothetical protein [Bdellovibrionales bacterium]
SKNYRRNLQNQGIAIYKQCTTNNPEYVLGMQKAAADLKKMQLAQQAQYDKFKRDAETAQRELSTIQRQSMIAKQQKFQSAQAKLQSATRKIKILEEKFQRELQSSSQKQQMYAAKVAAKRRQLIAEQRSLAQAEADLERIEKSGFSEKDADDKVQARADASKALGKLTRLKNQARSEGCCTGAQAERNKNICDPRGSLSESDDNTGNQ